MTCTPSMWHMSPPSSNFNHPSFNISLAGLDNLTLFQIYCLNPPSDSCPYGPCPNPDITGLGQQVALYITSTIFAINLIHYPESIRYAWYGYIANVYSLLIATVTSIARGQLTQNDAVFVIVAAASPATMYLWFLCGIQLIQPRELPSFLSGMGRTERGMMVILSFCLLVFWLAMLPVVFGSLVTFSQPECNKRYGAADIVNLFWTFLLCLDWFGTILASVFVTMLEGRRKRRDSQPGGLSILENSIFRWSRDAINHAFPQPECSMWKHPSLLLHLMMIDRLLSYTQQIENLSFSIETIAFFITLLVVLNNTAGPCMPPRTPDALLLLAFTALLAAFPWTRLSPVLIITRASWCAILWESKGRPGRIAGHTFCVAVLILVILISIAFHILMARVHGPWKYGFTFMQGVWPVAWVICGCKPSWRWGETISRIWSGTVRSSPVFKCLTLVIGPNLAWIFSTVVANSAGSSSSSSSFGQICATITSIASLSSLSFEIIDHRAAFIAAFWLTPSHPGSGTGTSTGIELEPQHPGSSMGALPRTNRHSRHQRSRRLTGQEDPNMRTGGRRYNDTPRESELASDRNPHQVHGNQIEDTRDIEYIHEQPQSNAHGRKQDAVTALASTSNQSRLTAQYASGSRPLSGLEAFEDPNLLKRNSYYNDTPEAKNNLRDVEGSEIGGSKIIECVYEEQPWSKGNRRKNSEAMDEGRRRLKARKAWSESPDDDNLGGTPHTLSFFNVI